MNDHDRLEQLRVLIDRLERLPQSPDRDWMLAEVRARAVDVETGVRPAPIRPRNPDAISPPSDAAAEPEPRMTRPPHRRPAEVRRPNPQPSPAASGEPAAPRPVPAPPAGDDERVDLLASGDVLCLGDLPFDTPADAGPVRSAPWARGLRG